MCRGVKRENLAASCLTSEERGLVRRFGLDLQVEFPIIDNYVILKKAGLGPTSQNMTRYFSVQKVSPGLQVTGLRISIQQLAG